VFVQCKDSLFLIQKAGKHLHDNGKNISLGDVLSSWRPFTEWLLPPMRGGQGPGGALTRRGPPREFHPRGLSVTAIGTRPDGYTFSIQETPERWPSQIPRGWATNLTQIEDNCSDLCRFLPTEGPDGLPGRRFSANGGYKHVKLPSFLALQRSRQKAQAREQSEYLHYSLLIRILNHPCREKHFAELRETRAIFGAIIQALKWLTVSIRSRTERSPLHGSG